MIKNSGGLPVPDNQNRRKDLPVLFRTDFFLFLFLYKTALFFIKNETRIEKSSQFYLISWRVITG